MRTKEGGMMEDLTGLGKATEAVAKLADSQLVIKTYDDLLADAMKEGSKGLVDTVKAFRLFTAPIQLLAVAQDRLAAFCDEVRNKVPEERQQEAPPSVALPVLMSVRFLEDDNPIRQLFAELLARAIDKERCDEAHPAFCKIIEQLSPEEAVFMCQFRESDEWPYPMPVSIGIRKGEFPLEWLPDKTRFYLYTEHLKALNLIATPRRRPTEGTILEWAPVEPSPDDICLTQFGKLFVNACIPDDFTLPTPQDDQ